MSDEKSSILNLRIAKKAYVFDQKRRFEHTERFALKRAQGDKPELKDVVDTFLGKRQGFGHEQQQEAARATQPSSKPKPQPQKKKSSAFGAIIKTGIAVVLLFAIVLLYVVSSASGASDYVPQQPSTPSFSGNFSFSVLDSSIVTYGTEDSPSNAARFLLSYYAQNVSFISADANLYASQPQQQIYLLRSRRDSAESYPEFAFALSSLLRSNGLSVNEIDVQALQSIPGGSTIVIPSGYLPLSLISGNQRTLSDVASAGNTIIYIGLPFDASSGSAALSDSGQPVPVPQADFNRLGFNFTRTKPSSTNDFRLFDAQYVVGTERLFGSVSVLRVGGGQILFLPQSLDGGWRGNGAAAGEDVARLISTSPWLAPFATAHSNSSALYNYTGQLSLVTTPFSANDGYALFYVQATDSNGITQGMLRTVQVRKLQRGDLFVNYQGPPPPPSSVARSRVRMSVVLREQSSSPVKLYVETIDGLQAIKTDPLEPDATVPTLTRFFDYDPNVPPGTYVISVQDSSAKQYAAGLLTVGDVEIIPVSLDWKNGAFAFRITSGGQAITARKVSASVDGKYAGDFTLSSEIQLSAKDLQPGIHVFSFQIGDMRKDLQIDYSRSRAFYENPLAIFLGILAAVIFGVGFFLRLPDKVMFGLDVPDFPPLSAIKIPVRRATVLEMFEQVNRDYSWGNMPLTLDEIKNGFRKLTYNGKPILIGDYNLERILSRLEAEGLVKHELSYYLLSQWEQKTGRSAFYLCAYRAMRDIFIANTVRFSKFASQKDCDVKITLASKDAYVHIYESQSAKAAALRTAASGPTLIVFRDEGALFAFESTLHAASRTNAAFKMEMESGSITILTIAQLSGYLKGMRPA